MKKQNNYRFLRNLILPQRVWFLSLSLFILLLTGINLIQTKTIQVIIDSTIEGNSDSIRTALLVMIGLLVANIVLTYIKSLCAARFTSTVCKNIKAGLTRCILKAPYRAIMQCSSGDLLKTVNTDTEAVCGFLGGSFTGLLSQVVMLVGAFLYLFCTNPLLALLTFIYTPFGMMLTYRINRKKGILYPEVARIGGEAVSLYEQILLQIPVIRSFAMEKIRSKRIKEKLQEAYQLEKQIAGHNAYLQTACSMEAQIPKIIFLLIVIFLEQKGMVSFGSMIALYEILNYIIAPTVYFPFLLDGLLQARASALRIEELSSRLEKEQPNIVTSHIIHSEKEKSAYIMLHDMTFGYEKDIVLLNKFNFIQEQPGITVITGESGTGKTTLLDLLSGLLEPLEGAVKVSGKIFTMTQETFLFSGSVLDNILVVKPEADLAQVVLAAKQAGADDFIQQLPEGYDTKIGDGNLELSGGQKQRIGLTRMVLSDADIILMDEPTSSLDEETEGVILKTILSLAKEKIILIAAHRFSLIELADRRIEL